MKTVNKFYVINILMYVDKTVIKVSDLKELLLIIRVRSLIPTKGKYNFMALK